MLPPIGLQIMSTPKSDADATHHHSSPNASAFAVSMVGQPVSEDGPAGPRSETESGSDGFTTDLIRLLDVQGGPLGGNLNHQDLIMHERLDEKEAMFMNGTSLMTIFNWPLTETHSSVSPTPSCSKCAFQELEK